MDKQPESNTAQGDRPPDQGREWMLAFQAGDDAAFDAMVLHFHRPVQHFLFRYIRDTGRAEDLAQEVFIRVYRSRNRYEPRAGFKTWLFTIATRLALNEIRGLRRRRRLFVETSDAADEGQAPWENSADLNAESPESRVEQQELEQIVDDVIAKLPENQRSALVLSRVEELSYREIAETLDVTVMAVKSLLMRARETLRSRLQPYLSSGRQMERPTQSRAAARTGATARSVDGAPDGGMP